MLLFSKFERFKTYNDHKYSDKQGKWIDIPKTYLLNKKVRMDHIFSIEKHELAIEINKNIFNCQADEDKFMRSWRYETKDDCNKDYEHIKKQLANFN